MELKIVVVKYVVNYEVVKKDIENLGRFFCGIVCKKDNIRNSNYILKIFVIFFIFKVELQLYNVVWEDVKCKEGCNNYEYLYNFFFFYLLRVFESCVEFRC